jgi:5-methylcytosine-specific restriction endonuclease McrA
MPTGVYKRTAWHRERISNSCKGKIISLEQRLKLSVAHKGLRKPWAAEVGRRQAEKQRGCHHWNWKGGVSRAYKTGYYSLEYKNWRREVFVRDSFICQQCGSREYVTAHHVKSFAKYPELRFDISNGITLCETCHKKTDNYKGKVR